MNTTPEPHKSLNILDEVAEIESRLERIEHPLSPLFIGTITAIYGLGMLLLGLLTGYLIYAS